MQQNINSILMRVVAVLLMLVLLSTAMVTGRFARYTSSSSGEDAARVAKFDVSRDTNNYEAYFSVTIQPGEKTPLNIHVVNNSEVTVSLDFQVENVHCNLPLRFLYEETGHLNPGETGDIPLMIYWPISEEFPGAEEEDDPITVQYNSTTYCGMVDLLKISMTAVQVD